MMSRFVTHGDSTSSGCPGADAAYGLTVPARAAPGSLEQLRHQSPSEQPHVLPGVPHARPAQEISPLIHDGRDGMESPVLCTASNAALIAPGAAAGLSARGGLPLRTNSVQFKQLRRWLSRETSFRHGPASRRHVARDNVHARTATNEEEIAHNHIIERLPLYAWTALQNGQVEFVSKRLTALTGVAPFADDCINVIHADDRARTVAAWIHAVATRTPYDIEHRVHMLDGNIRWMRSRANLQRDGSGRVEKWYGVSEDIHDAKQAVTLLEQRSAWLLAIADSVNQLIWASTPDGCVDYNNQAWHDFTGIQSSADSAGRIWSQPDKFAGGLRHHDDQDRCRAAWHRCLQTGEPYQVEYRLRHRSGQYRWVLARAHAVRSADGRIERWYGAVTDIHEIVEARDALARSREEMEQAKQWAEDASAAKSRFLAVASHDLRQPLQTMTLLESLLAKKVAGDGDAGRLVTRLNETMGTMAGMLDVLLDVDRIEAGTMRAEVTDFSMGALLNRLRREFAYHAQAKGLVLQVMPCSAVVQSDPRLLEQMIRNLVSNALKYTPHGRVLLGCRRRGDVLSIEVWDTGVGIADGDLQAIFEEYYQVGNEARERSRGVGLGLSIVQRLGGLLGHQVRLRSQPGKGSAFSIEVACRPGAGSPAGLVQAETGNAGTGTVRRAGRILVIEDDPDLREALQTLLLDDGHSVMGASSGLAASGFAGRSLATPDLILSDYNLSGDLNGLQAVARARDTLARAVPGIILTGDTSAAALRDVASQGHVHRSKPVKPGDLLRAVQTLLPLPPAVKPCQPEAQPKAASCPDAPLIHVVDDDACVREVIRRTLEHNGHAVEDYPSGQAFLAAYHLSRPGREECLLIDAAMPGMDGLEVLRRLDADGHRMPTIMITGYSDVPTAVHAMKAGVLDFVEKPLSAPELLDGVARALDQSRDAAKRSAWQTAAADSVAMLTQRQRDVMTRILAGQLNKNIAADLGISQRTVETHRSTIMRKMGVKSLAALTRLALAASSAKAGGHCQLVESRLR